MPSATASEYAARSCPSSRCRPTSGPSCPSPRQSASSDGRAPGRRAPAPPSLSGRAEGRLPPRPRRGRDDTSGSPMSTSAGRGGLLEAGRHVHRVPRDQPLARGDVPGDHLSGVHAGSVRQPHALAHARAPRSTAPGHPASRVAAVTARSASSSWSFGSPKTAITASPMNFSTAPP